MTKITQLVTQCRRLSKERIVSQSCFSRSQLYRWLKGEQLERKQRARKVLPEQTVENAACVIGMFPHFSGRKGQDYLLYHELGLIGEKAYEGIKRSVRQLFLEEVGRRELFGEKAFYEHHRPQAVGEIWAEDFTELVVEGETFRAALLQDVFDQYYPGWAVARRATASLVGRPVDQALAANGGRGPKKFLLSDNGSQYISEEHDELLTSVQIVQRRIPACVPQYNGWIECGMRQFKSVFYSVNPGSRVVLREFSGGECGWQGASGKATTPKTTTPREHSLVTDRERWCPHAFPLATATGHSHLPLGLHLAAALPRYGCFAARLRPGQNVSQRPTRGDTVSGDSGWSPHRTFASPIIV